MEQRTCSIDGCDGQVKARGWCNPHWIRWKRYGDPVAVILGPRWPEVCRVDGCDKQATGRGLCHTHYSRWKRTGDVGAHVPVVPHLAPFAPDATCAVGGCDKSPKGGGRGWCHTHFERWRKTGNVNAAKPITHRVYRYPADSRCLVEGCEGKPAGRGLCGAHYARWLEDGDVRAQVPVGRRISLPPGTPCSVDGCEKPVQCRDMCGMHYARQLRYGDPHYVPEKVAACRVEGCEKPPPFSRGLCEAHYAKLLRYGDPEWRFNPKPMSEVGYIARHDRVRRARGKATEYRCVRCSAQAVNWAWIHGEDPADLDSYMPMCRACHMKYDLGPERYPERTTPVRRKRPA